MTRRLRDIAAPFVVAAPSGARVSTRLAVSEADTALLQVVGGHLGALASRDLAERCRQGRLSAQERAVSRRDRKRSLTAPSSSRWAGAITRTSEDAFGLALRNLVSERRSLRARVGRIRRLLQVPVGGRQGRVRGYATGEERYQEQRRLQILEHRLAVVDRRLLDGRVSVWRGGTVLARAHHHLAEAGLSERQWRQRWGAERLFLTADGEKDQSWGNLTIRWHPDEHWVELALPGPLAHLANRPRGRYRRSCPVTFSYRGDEVAAQAATGAVRYDIFFSPQKRRWYLDVSWKCPAWEPQTLERLRTHPVLSIDLNAGHLAAIVVDPSGNLAGSPFTIPLALTGLPATIRDGRLRQAISRLLATARDNGCLAVAIENLDFAEAREASRERSGNRPSRGARARRFRHMLAGIPTARFRDPLVQMAANAGLFVIAVDPAYTSRWRVEHWLGSLEEVSADASGHHAAALVIGRRGLGQRARQRRRCDSTPAVHGGERATRPVLRPEGTGRPVLLSEQQARNVGNRGARGQPHQRRKTQTAERTTPTSQVAQDRSGPPTRRDRVPLSVWERCSPPARQPVHGGRLGGGTGQADGSALRLSPGPTSDGHPLRTAHGPTGLIAQESHERQAHLLTGLTETGRLNAEGQARPGRRQLKNRELHKRVAQTFMPVLGIGLVLVVVGVVIYGSSPAFASTSPRIVGNVGTVGRAENDGKPLPGSPGITKTTGVLDNTTLKTEAGGHSAQAACTVYCPPQLYWKATSVGSEYATRGQWHDFWTFIGIDAPVTSTLKESYTIGNTLQGSVSAGVTYIGSISGMVGFAVTRQWTYSIAGTIRVGPGYYGYGEWTTGYKTYPVYQNEYIDGTTSPSFAERTAHANEGSGMILGLEPTNSQMQPLTGPILVSGIDSHVTMFQRGACVDNC